MNTKSFNLLQKNLQLAFNLPKYAAITIDADTNVHSLPWTPARYAKFKDAVEAELSLPCEYRGTLREISLPLLPQQLILCLMLIMYMVFIMFVLVIRIICTNQVLVAVLGLQAILMLL